MAMINRHKSKDVSTEPIRKPSGSYLHVHLSELKCVKKQKESKRTFIVPWCSGD